VHLSQKVLFVLPVVKPRLRLEPENLNSDEKDALFDLDTQITILIVSKIKIQKLVSFLSFPPNYLTTRQVCSFVDIPAKQLNRNKQFSKRKEKIALPSLSTTFYCVF
jgi:hypothetical protein